MLERKRYWGIVWTLCAVVVAGCTGVPPTRVSAQKHDAEADRRRHMPGEAALEKRAEAHAHYAAGVIAEVSEQPDAALKEYSQAALKDPKRRPHLITFTSSSTARNFVTLLGKTKSIDGIKLASIGPVTSSTLRELGLPVDIEAKKFTIPGLVKAIVVET